MRIVEDHVHGPRRKVKIGTNTFLFHGVCDEDPDNPRFVYRVARYTPCPEFTDHWTGYYREDVGGLKLVAFGTGDSPAFIPMGEIARQELCRICVP